MKQKNIMYFTGESCVILFLKTSEGIWHIKKNHENVDFLN